MPAQAAPSERTSITYLLTHFPAVSHTFISDEVRHLEQFGIDVLPVSINSPRPSDIGDEQGRIWADRTHYIKATPKRRLVSQAARTLLRHPSLALLPLRQGGFDVKAWVWRSFQMVEAISVARYMHDHASRHVHAHFGQTPATIAHFATEVGRTCWPSMPWTWSVTIHGWHEFVNEEAANLRRKVVAADLVVCISDFTRSQLYRIAPVDAWGKVQVVRCGVELSRFPLRATSPDDGPAHIIMVARLSPEKGHTIMLQALAMLQASGNDIVLDLVGNGPDDYEQHLRDQVAELAVRNVVFHGATTPDTVSELLGKATVFCLPTFAEGLPVVIMEAMARGIPVVTTYISGIPELCVDGETALVVPAGRADLLADALQRVIADEGLRDRLTKLAAERVREAHDISVNAPQLAALLTGVTRVDVIRTGAAGDNSVEP